MAKKLGSIFANLRNNLQKIGNTFKQVEDSELQFNERFFELRTLLYNGRMEYFNEIETDFLSKNNNRIVWTDGDQKNIAINQEGDVIVFDLGRSIICDPDFMLPNLLGHISLFIISGHLVDGVHFLKECQNSFEELYRATNPSYKIDEVKFVNYFTAALLHRGMAMRWIDPKIAEYIGEDSLKYSCMHFGDIIFDKKGRVRSIDKAYKILEKITKLAIEGAYKRRLVSRD